MSPARCSSARPGNRSKWSRWRTSRRASRMSPEVAPIFGLITTNDIRTRSAAAGADLRPVVTFGARRSPLYPDTPTFAEVTGHYKNDFTYSFALFGPPKLDEDLNRNLAQAALTACARPAALIGAGEANLPLACRGARGARADARAGPAGGAPRLSRRTVNEAAGGLHRRVASAGPTRASLRAGAWTKPSRTGGGPRRQATTRATSAKGSPCTFRRVAGMISSGSNGPGKMPDGMAL